jgi:hypothetical protein
MFPEHIHQIWDHNPEVALIGGGRQKTPSEGFGIYVQNLVSPGNPRFAP